MSDTTDVVVFGTGKVGEVVYYYLDRHPDYSVAAFTADAEYINREKLFGKDIVPFADIEDVFSPAEFELFTAVAYSDGNQLRAQKYREGKQKEYDFISYVDPNATVAENAEIGENCFIFEENVVQPFVDIGDNVILWSGNHVGHHSTIERNCFVSSHVVISGNVHIAKNCFLGVNATLADGIDVGAGAVVGADALLVDDTVGHKVYGGQPASVLREVEES